MRVEAHGVEAKESRRAQRQQPAQAGHPEGEPGRDAQARQDQRLDQRLPRQAQPRGSQRRLERHLGPPPEITADEEVRDVHAREHEDQADRSEKRSEDRPHLAGGVLSQRDGEEAAPRRRVLGVLGLQAPPEGRDLLLRGLGLGVVAQAAQGS